MAKPPNRRVSIRLMILEERAVPADITIPSGLSGLNSTTLNQAITAANNSVGTTTIAATPATTPGTSGSRSGTTTNTSTTPASEEESETTAAATPAAPAGPAFLADRGTQPNALLVDDAGAQTQAVAVFETTFTGGAWVARADVTGDGVPDAIVGAGPGGAPVVRVVDGRDSRIVRSFLAYEESFSGGVLLTVMDLNGDGRAEIITGTDQGGGARVRIFNGLDNAVIADFNAIDDTAFRGGVRVAIGDINGDGTPDLIAAAGHGGGPRVALFDGNSILQGGGPIRFIADFFAFEPSLRNGVYISAGDVDGDTRDDLLVGAGPGGAPRVMAVSGAKLLGDSPSDAVARPLYDFFAGLGDDRGGVRIGAVNRTDGRVDLMTVGGSGGDASVYDVDSRKISRRVNRELAYGAGLIDDRTPATESTATPETGTGATSGMGTGTGTGTGTTNGTGTGTGTTTTNSTLQQLLSLFGGTTTGTSTTTTGIGSGTSGTGTGSTGNNNAGNNPRGG